MLFKRSTTPKVWNSVVDHSDIIGPSNSSLSSGTPVFSVLGRKRRTQQQRLALGCFNDILPCNISKIPSRILKPIRINKKSRHLIYLYFPVNLDHADNLVTLMKCSPQQGRLTNPQYHQASSLVVYRNLRKGVWGGIAFWSFLFLLLVSHSYVIAEDRITNIMGQYIV